MRTITSGTISAFAALVYVGAAALAGLSQSDIVAPGGFMQAGASGSSPGGTGIPGTDSQSNYNSVGADFNEQSYMGDSVAAASASFMSGSTSNSSWGEARMGRIRMTAANTAPNNSFFAEAGTNGGFKETFTVSHPALTGQAGFLVVRVRAKGALHAADFAGSASVWANAYKNNLELSQNAHWNKGDSDAIGTDRQRVRWAVSTFASGTVSNRTIDDAVLFSVPITFGTSFTMGVYASSEGGMRSSSGVAGTSTGTADFSAGGICWDGVVAVYHDGAPIDGYTVVSGTGIDWTGPVGADCPGDTNGDGVVDFTDFSTVLNQYGQTGPGLSGDLNNDGVVDFTDFSIVLANYGTNC